VEPLVSIIVPCFNAGRWIKEALDSCLCQTCPRIETIVVDDGSTDRSLDIIKEYGSKIRWISGPNRGGGHARNKGFALSQGEYIQFLDADDYILPEKIQRQVEFLRKNEADIVYGDWRYKTHAPDSGFDEQVKIAGHKEDILESFLRGFWVAPNSYLLKRQVIEKFGGWDESLKAGQDGAFFLSLALAGARFAYQRGCYSVYRKYGPMTVASSDPYRWVESHAEILSRAEGSLRRQNRLSLVYRKALIDGYVILAKSRNLGFITIFHFHILKKILSLISGMRPAVR